MSVSSNRGTAKGIVMLFMVVEHFRNRDPLPIYRRFRERGRMAPDGVTYVSSWVDDKFERCFQLMATDDRELLDRWIAGLRIGAT